MDVDRSIPSDWRVFRVKDIATIGTGSRNTQDRKVNGAYPFYVRSQTVERIDTYSFEGEAVLTAGDGVGTGKVFHYDTGRHEVHQRVYRIANFSNQMMGRFFFHYFSRHFYDRIMAMTAKSSVDSVRMEMIADMDIPCPPVDEQLKITAALDDGDGLAAALEQLIAKKKNLSTAVLWDLVHGRRRLPGHNGDWERRRLGDVLRVRHGKSQHAVARMDGRYPILATSGEIGRADRWLYDRPSVLIGRKGTIDAPQFAEEPFWSIDTLFFTEIGSDADPKFVFYLFRTIPWRSFNEASGVPSLNSSVIEAIEARMPPLSEQRAIAEVLTDMDAEIQALIARLAKTRQLNEAMAQSLLSGATRVHSTAGPFVASGAFS